MPESLLRCDNVSKKFCRDLKKSLWYGVQDSLAELFPARQTCGELRAEEFWANRKINFELKRGECLGLIGRNGAGKTTLLKMLTGLIKPDTGKITLRGKTAALIALGAGFNPVLTGRENIHVNASILGLSKSQTSDKLDEIIDFSELDDFLDTPVRNYSSGMQVRLGFACAAILLRPDILILDEVLAVGDMAFRAKCYERVSKLLENAAVVFVSHSIPQVARICTKCLYLKSGITVRYDNTPEVLKKYLDDSMIEGTRSTIGKQCVSVGRFTIDDSEVETSQTSVIKFGQTLELGLELNSHEEIARAEIIFSFTDSAGEIAAQFSSAQSNTTLGPLTSGITTIIRASVISLTLNPGTYNVNIVILDQTNKARHLAWIRNIAIIQISGEQLGQAATQLCGAWSLVTSPTTPDFKSTAKSLKKLGEHNP